MLIDILSSSSLYAIWLTVKLASLTMVLLLIVGVPLAWWLAKTQCFMREIIAALVAVPFILPPTVLGFYLLIAMGKGGPLGSLAAFLGFETFAFRFEGLLIGSMIYSLPFMVQPVRNAFEMIGSRPLEVAATLRHSPLMVFLTVALPLCRSQIITAAILCFAHTMGEYGVVMMIGGNLPQTSVISTKIVQLNETQYYSEAAFLSLIMIMFSFFIIVTIMVIERQKKKKDNA